MTLLLVLALVAVFATVSCCTSTLKERVQIFLTHRPNVSRCDRQVQTLLILGSSVRVLRHRITSSSVATMMEGTDTDDVPTGSSFEATSTNCE